MTHFDLTVLSNISVANRGFISVEGAYKERWPRCVGLDSEDGTNKSNEELR